MKRHFKRSLILLFALFLLAGSSYAQEKSPKRQDNVEPKMTGKRKAAVNKNVEESAKPSTRTVMFYINDTTGEISGCPFLKKIDKVPVSSQRAEYDDMLFSKIRAEIEPFQLRESGQSEIFTGGVYNKSKTRLVTWSCLHGGDLYELRFYSGEGTLLNKQKMDGKYNISETVAFNAAETHVMVTLTNGDFWIFDVNGRIVLKANANNIIKDSFYDSWSINVNKSGNLILLSGQNGSVLFNESLKILHVFDSSVNSSYFDDELNLLFVEIGKLLVFKIHGNKIVATAESNEFRYGHLDRNILIVQNPLNIKIRYYYEIL